MIGDTACLHICGVLNKYGHRLKWLTNYCKSLGDSAQTPSATGEGTWSCVQVGQAPVPTPKPPTEFLDMLDVSVRSLLPKAPVGDVDTPLVKLVRDAAQDNGTTSLC